MHKVKMESLRVSEGMHRSAGVVALDPFQHVLFMFLQNRTTRFPKAHLILSEMRLMTVPGSKLLYTVKVRCEFQVFGG